MMSIDERHTRDWNYEGLSVVSVALDGHGRQWADGSNCMHTRTARENGCAIIIGKRADV